MAKHAPRRRLQLGFLAGAGLLIGLPLLLIIAVNIVLATPPACRWVATQLKHRTGLSARIDRISFWPWDGIRIHGLTIAGPNLAGNVSRESLVRIRTIHVYPAWSRLLHGKPDISSLTLDHPRLAIPVELLAALQPPGRLKVTPTLAGNQAQSRSNSAPGSPPPKAPPTAQTTAPKAATAGQTSAEKPKSNHPSARPTAWCHLKQASVVCYSATTHGQKIEISDIDGDIPIRGKPATSRLDVADVSFNHHRILQNLSIPLQWKHPRLNILPFNTSLLGIDLRMAASLFLTRHLPLEISLESPAQRLPKIQLAGAKVQVKQMVSQARFIGMLSQPHTWRGEVIAKLLQVSARFGLHDTQFDHGDCLLLLRGGLLSCPDFRLIGEQASLLGNANAFSDGRWAANLRLVAAPERAIAVAKSLFPKIPIKLTPLSSPQRSAFDLEASGNLKQFSLEVGNQGPTLTFHR